MRHINKRKTEEGKVHSMRTREWSVKGELVVWVSKNGLERETMLYLAASFLTFTYFYLLRTQVILRTKTQTRYIQ